MWQPRICQKLTCWPWYSCDTPGLYLQIWSSSPTIQSSHKYHKIRDVSQYKVVWQEFPYSDIELIKAASKEIWFPPPLTCLLISRTNQQAGLKLVIHYKICWCAIYTCTGGWIKANPSFSWGRGLTEPGKNKQRDISNISPTQASIYLTIIFAKSSPAQLGWVALSSLADQPSGHPQKYNFHARAMPGSILASWELL